MPMREQPDGVHRVRRGTGQPASAYDIYLDGELTGWVERQHPGRPGSAWRAYPEHGEWPRVFGRPGGYLAAVEWLAELHRAARQQQAQTSEPVTAAEGAGVEALSPAVADPFREDPFADPLA